MHERGFRTAGEDLPSCSHPLLERRLKPPPEQALKCPRCKSTNTKFCYYNNYSLSQPYHFCKTCRRYWTKGGTLRTVPIGGGCRKNKRAKRTVAAEHPVFNTQNEPSTSATPSASALPIALDHHQNDLNPANNSSSYFNLSSHSTAGSTEASLAFARIQQAARKPIISIVIGICDSFGNQLLAPRKCLDKYLLPISFLQELAEIIFQSYL